MKWIYISSSIISIIISHYHNTLLKAKYEKYIEVTSKLTTATFYNNNIHIVVCTQDISW